MAARKKGLLLLAAACLLGAAAYLYSIFCQQGNQEELVLQGNVDVRRCPWLSARVTGYWKC